MMMHRYAAALGLLVGSLAVSTAQAQSGGGFGFEPRAAAKVVAGSDTLRHAWAGGLNTPQFSSIDLDGDGRNDLFAFDRQSSRCYTFLNVAAPGGGRRWQYAPDYEALFPDDLVSWALLRDYDCDGRPDLFTATANNGVDIRVLRNVPGPSGRPGFTLASGLLEHVVTPTFSTNITTDGYSLPAIQDVDGDGKIDVLVYNFDTSTRIEYYRNVSPGSCGGALAFVQDNSYWGGVTACGTCTGFQPAGQPCVEYRRPLHTPGHAITLVDLDGDGDQDLLDGRDNCEQLTRLLNQGTAAVASLPASGISASWPTATNPLGTKVFPAAYYLDATLDGRPDLVVAPSFETNSADRVSARNSVRVWPNSAASGAPAFGAAPRLFLQDEMLDVSEGAAPAVGDLSGDGLPDLLIGNYADHVGTDYRAALAYYRNEGTRARPVLRLVTDDYLGLAARGAGSNSFTGLRPALVDINRDGALDLVFSVYENQVNRLYFLLNTAPAGQPAAFNTAQLNYFKGQGPEGSGILPYQKADAPCFVDVDRDGFVDLLVGTDETREPGMSLRYFRNRGRGPVDSLFRLADNDFGRIRGANGTRPKLLSPAVADYDGDGQDDLLTVDQSGVLRFFPSFRTQPAAFFGRTDLVYNALTTLYADSRLGQGPSIRHCLAVADFNLDGNPELLIGTEAGGVLSFATRGRLLGSRSASAQALALSLFPNPARGSATVRSAAPVRLALFDALGRQLRQAPAPAREHALDLRGLAPGLYLVRATAPDGATATQRLVVE